jgi:hypothetical protein
MELVSRVLQTCKEERSKYELTVDALQYNSLEGFDLKELRGSADDVPEDGELQEEQNEQEELKQDEKLVRKEKKVYNLHALSAMHKHSVAVKTDWQNQGNSTDVYRIVVKEEGSDVVYYIKENLPLLSSDVEGFLDRRLTELASSKQAHVSNDSSREELRMREAHMKEADYDACTRFLTAIKNKIQNAPAAERLNVRKRMTAIFAHDFDRMFKQLHYHNQAARILDKEGDNFDVAKWTAVAKNQDNPQYEIAKILLDYMGYDLEGNKIDASDAGAEAREPLKEINEKDWIIKELKLNEGTDQDLGRLLGDVFGQDQKSGIIENLFRISLGKEVELFGQMRDRTAGDAEEITATNNTATSRLATRTGFSDVVTVSESRIVRFKDRNGNEVERFCTVMKEAEGDEFLDVLKRAGDENKQIEYTPDVIRELMRLNAFDMVCLQVDRHGRNFKCKTEEKDGKIIITRVMSYDHDMSFGEESLKDAFKDGQDKGFLKNPTQVIKKDSPMYRYVVRNYFHLGGKMSFLDDIAEPDWARLIDDCKEHSRFRVKLEKLAGNLNSFISVPFQQERYMSMRFNIEGSNLNQANSLYEGHVRTSKGEELNEDEEAEVTSRLGETYGQLMNVLYDKKSKSLKSKFNKEEKADLSDALFKLYELDKNYDFFSLSHKDSQTSGLVTLWIKKTLYTYSQVLKAERERENIDDMINEEPVSREQKDEIRANLARITDPETGDIVIPTMLHFDMDAWIGIQTMKSSLEGKDGIITGDLKGLGFRDAKIDKLRQRCADMEKMVLEAKNKAEAFYRLAGWKNDTPQGRFFLKKEDYASFKNMSELSVDPGQTYLSIDNENFLFGNAEYQKFATQAMKQRALEAERKKQTDSKRGKNPDYLKGLGEDLAMSKFLKNPLSGNIHGAA